jgi:predicted GNAT family N-acyltransferase
MEEVRIRCISTADAEYIAMLDLRDEVLRKPLGQRLDRNNLSAEAFDFLVVMEINGIIKGCVILTPISKDILKLRQMAVAGELQGKGMGHKILKWAEELALSKGFVRIEMNARKYAIPFYEKAGYVKYGDEFTEVGIPHYKMKKSLSGRL